MDFLIFGGEKTAPILSAQMKTQACYPAIRRADGRLAVYAHRSETARGEDLCNEAVKAFQQAIAATGNYLETLLGTQFPIFPRAGEAALYPKDSSLKYAGARLRKA